MSSTDRAISPPPISNPTRSTQTPKKESSVQRGPLTHFLCIPLITPQSRAQLQTSLTTFAKAVCPSATDIESSKVVSESTITLPSSAIRPLGSLHLTLGVMRLPSSESIPSSSPSLNDALTLLQSLRFHPQTFLPLLSGESLPTLSSHTSSLRTNLTGLSCMGSPSHTSVLYAHPSDALDQESGKLETFCREIRKMFLEKGLLVDEGRDLKLHATVVNTLYSKNKDKGTNKNQRSNKKFDAVALIDRWKDYTWAEDITIDRVSICEMGAKKIHDREGKVIDEVYTEVGSVSLIHS